MLPNSARKNGFGFLGCIVVAGTLLSLTGCCTTLDGYRFGCHPKLCSNPYFIDGSTDPNARPHVIQPADVLEVVFPFKPIVVDATEPRLQSPPEQTYTITVQEDGMISLPLIPPVQAAGVTPQQLQEQLVVEYKKIQYSPREDAELSKQYLVMVNDTLNIRFRNQPDLDQTVIVGPDGRINLFLVGNVQVEGLSTDQITKRLTELYSKELPTDLELIVNLSDFSSTRVYIDGEPKQLGPRDVDGIVVQIKAYERYVYVTGEVAAPKMVTFRNTITASQAITAAGGHKRSARLRKVVILRRQGAAGSPVAIVADLSGTLRGEGAADLALEHLDLIVVPKTPITKVTDVLEQYLYQVVPFTRNSPVISFFYNLSQQPTNIVPAATAQ